MSEIEKITLRWSSDDPANEFTVYNPTTGKPARIIKGSGVDEVNAAIDFAYETYQNKWRHVPGPERGRLMLECARVIEEHKEELAKLESIEHGKPVGQAMGDVLDCISHFQMFGGLCLNDMPSHVRDIGSIINVSTVEPFGVVAGICPFNWPALHAGAKLAPALAVGNCVVIKPPEQDPSVIIRICELLDTVLPEGVVICIPGVGAAGAALSANRKVRMISFTGSSNTGRAVAKSAADNLIPLLMELGGKNALIIFDDCDVKQAIRDIIDGAFINQGEACTAASRILIQDTVYDQIVPTILKAVPRLKVGLSLDPTTHVGPIVSRKQQQSILNHIKIGVEEGATLAAQAPVPTDEEHKDGFWVAPTVFTDVTPDMRIAKEEIFGPVTCIIKFHTYEEAIEIANGTDYGLVCGVYSKDFEKCWQVSKDVDAGSFFINHYHRASILGAPFGGVKDSGYGRERYIDTLREFGTVKTRKIKTGLAPIPHWFAVDEVLADL